MAMSISSGGDNDPMADMNTAKYDDVAQVLAMAQRNGIQRIGFTGQEQLID